LTYFDADEKRRYVPHVIEPRPAPTGDVAFLCERTPKTRCLTKTAITASERCSSCTPGSPDQAAGLPW